MQEKLFSLVVLHSLALVSKSQIQRKLAVVKGRGGHIILSTDDLPWGQMENSPRFKRERSTSFSLHLDSFFHRCDLGEVLIFLKQEKCGCSTGFWNDSLQTNTTNPGGMFISYILCLPCLLPERI